MLICLSVQLQWLPSSGRGDFRHLVLPAITLGLFTTARITRLTRSGMLEVLSQDYIRTARAKGVSDPPVVWKHALKNAAIPIVTIVGIELGTLLGGSVITETIFAWPGVGRLSVQAIYNRDIGVCRPPCSCSRDLVLVNVVVMCCTRTSSVSGCDVARRRGPSPPCMTRFGPHNRRGALRATAGATRTALRRGGGSRSSSSPPGAPWSSRSIISEQSTVSA